MIQPTLGLITSSISFTPHFVGGYYCFCPSDNLIRQPADLIIITAGVTRG